MLSVYHVDPLQTFSQSLQKLRQNIWTNWKFCFKTGQVVSLVCLNALCIPLQFASLCCMLTALLFVSAASKALHGTASFLNELLFRAAADAWSIRSAGRGSIRSAGCGISRRVYGKNLAHRHPQHLVMKIPHYCAWLGLRFDDSSMRMDGTPEVRGKTQQTEHQRRKFFWQ